MSQEKKTAEEMANEVNENITALKEAIEAKADTKEVEAKMNELIKEDSKETMEAIKTWFEENKDDSAIKAVEELEERVKTIAKSLKEKEVGKVKVKTASELFSAQFANNVEKAKGPQSDKSNTMTLLAKMPINKVLNIAEITDPTHVPTPDPSNVSGDFVVETQVSRSILSAPRPLPIMFSLINFESINSPNFAYLEEVNETGSAAITQEGWLKPNCEFDLQSTTVKAQKFACHTCVTDEFLDDIVGAETYIKQKHVRDLIEKSSDIFLNGDGSYVGLKDQAATLIPPAPFATDIDFANRYDVILAAIAQVSSFNFGSDTGTPAILMNSATYYRMKADKGQDGHYLFPIVNGIPTIEGLPVVMTNQLSDEEYLVGDFSRFVGKLYKPAETRIGWINDQFIRNENCLVTEWRGMVYLPSVYVGAFVYGDFTTDIPLIQA